ncbi:NADPH-dependent FMN reductase [Companilactobacillus insicii]|uniref:NADPH-dependent FMN reductase n=1 Tax=Companilactobacillus insicii TaxID=1732567 RepID=UPI000F769688|nr:NAD(P)H-dependent oxidoreductase [Companilactobacillus insicii]
MTVKIGVILGSTRTKSLGGKILKYLQITFKSDNDVEYTWLDLRDYELPLYDHEETPLEEHIHDLNTIEGKWLDALAKQDGYIILAPEYDRAIPGGLKNALDLVGPETARKPVQVIAYSHFSDGGIVAANSIVAILQMLKMIVLPDPALLWFADNNFDDNGKLIPSDDNSEHFAKRLDEKFHEVEFYSRVLKENQYK